jgi:hypothetical protein
VAQEEKSVMNLRSVLILAAVLTGLFGYLYLYEKPKQQGLREEWEEKALIFTFNKDDVETFTLSQEYKNTDFIRVEGTDEYKIVKPVTTKADNLAVNKFFDELQKVNYASIIEGEEHDLREFKLDVPYFKLTLNLKGGVQKVFSLGKMNITEDRIYTKRNGDDNIYLVDISLRNVFDLDLYLLREKKIFYDSDFSGTSKIQLVRENKETILEKEEDGWLVTKPIKVAADIVEINSLFNNINRLKAVKFPIDNMELAKRCDFTTPDLSVILSDKDDKVIDTFMMIKKGPMVKKRLTIEEAEEEECLTTGNDNTVETVFFKAASKKGVYLIDHNDFTLLNKPLDDIRNKPIFTLSMDSVHRIEVVRDKKLLALSRDNKGGWENISDKNNVMSFNTADVANIFNYLSFVEADEFIDNADMNDKTYNFAASVLSLTFYDKSNNIIEVLTTGDVTVDHMFLKKHNDKTVYMINKDFLKRFEL